MVRVPGEEEGVSYRRIPEPDSEVMALSADGVMVHLREEGWKEARVASVSAVPVCVEGERAKGEPRLEKHSYRAGLWDANLYQPLLGREFPSRGGKGQTNRLHQRWRHLDLEMVFVCFIACIEILDWWHMLQKRLADRINRDGARLIGGLRMGRNAESLP